MTLKDRRIYDFMRDIVNTENIFLEPSACASFMGVVDLFQCEEGKQYIQKHGISMENSVHIAWATGGSLVPEEIRKEYMNTYL